MSRRLAFLLDNDVVLELAFEKCLPNGMVKSSLLDLQFLFFLVQGGSVEIQTVLVVPEFLLNK